MKQLQRTKGAVARNIRDKSNTFEKNNFKYSKLKKKTRNSHHRTKHLDFNKFKVKREKKKYKKQLNFYFLL